MLKVHQYSDLKIFGSNPKFPVPGDRVGWFFNDDPFGLVISVDPRDGTALILWSIPPRELPYIDDQGNFWTRISVMPAKPLEYIKIEFTVKNDD